MKISQAFKNESEFIFELAQANKRVCGRREVDFIATLSDEFRNNGMNMNITPDQLSRLKRIQERRR